MLMVQGVFWKEIIYVCTPWAPVCTSFVSRSPEIRFILIRKGVASAEKTITHTHTVSWGSIFLFLFGRWGRLVSVVQLHAKNPASNKTVSFSRFLTVGHNFFTRWTSKITQNSLSMLICCVSSYANIRKCSFGNFAYSTVCCYCKRIIFQCDIQYMSHLTDFIIHSIRSSR